MDTVGTQAIYDAVGQAHSQGLVQNTIIVCEPTYPVICIGYHQMASTDVDIDFCQRKGIPIVRRILGGGGVLLDRGQIFYQIIAKRGSGVIPYKADDTFEALLRPVVRTLRELGAPAQYRALNDIQVQGRKISGNGATIVGETLVLTGNIIVDFDYDQMCAALRVPSEKFRDKVAKSLKERVTTLRRELNSVPPTSEIERMLINNFERELSISLQQRNLTGPEIRLLTEIRRKYLSEQWLFEPEADHRDLLRKIELTISGSTRIVENSVKTAGGLIRVLLEAEDNLIRDAVIYGDFSFYPKEKLRKFEQSLKGVPLVPEQVLERTRHFFEEEKVETPGVSLQDFVSLLLGEATG